jgi:hypothetical protein
MSSVRITVLGAGGVGSSLAQAWVRAGHDVTVGVREPDADRYDAIRGQLRVSDVPTALDGAETVLLAVPGTAVPDLLTAHAALLDGKLVIDATNRMGRTVLHQVPLLEARLPKASLYRGFCSIGYEIFLEPVVGGERADLFFVGEDGPKRAVVEELVRDVGLRPVWMGGTDAADSLDGAARLWFALVAERGTGRRIALRLVSDDPIA